jgi:hypothetical protein
MIRVKLIAKRVEQSVGVWLLCLVLGSVLPVWAQPEVTVGIDGQDERAPVPKGLWEGQHLAFSARLLKRHERELLRYIPIRQVRTHDSDPSLDQISLGPGVYDFAVLDQFLDDLKELGDSGTAPGLFMNLEFTPRWLADAAACSRPAPRYNRPRDWGLWALMVEDTVRHIRQRAPDIERYYEVWNEPNMEVFWMPCESNRSVARQEYFRLYQETALAVRRADPDAKVGGPAIALYDEGMIAASWIPSFLDYCRDNALPIHFVSYHRYEDEAPRLDTQDGSSVRGWLRERRMENVQILNTEWNLYGGLDPASARDAAAYSAAIPARVLSMYKGTVDRSVYFSAPGAPQPLILPDERVHTTYNVFRMLGVLKGALVLADSDGLEDNGTGVGVLAAANRAEGTFAVLIWNYRYTDFSAPSAMVNLNVRSLPDFLRNRPLAYRRYLVDADTSNWLADPARDHLQQVEARGLAGSSSYADSLALQPNAVTLLLFCRQDGSCPDLSSPADQLGPVIRSVFVDWITADSATVTWTTSRPATSKVEYGTSLEYGLETDMESDLVTEHTVVLRDLAPNTRYYVRVVSADSAERQTESEDWWSFTTPGPGRRTRVFKPTDNTYVDDRFCAANPDVHFHTSAILSVRHTSARSFLRFDLSSIADNGDVKAQAAELRLFAVDYGDSGSRLYQTQETGWQETEVNCHWQPRPQRPLASLSGVVATGSAYRFTITDAVPQGSVFSFVLDQSLPWAKIAYSSTRHPHGPPPMLFVTVLMDP